MGKVFVGGDDGYRETKMWISEDRKIAIPSQAKAGENNQISIAGGGESVQEYKTSEGHFIVGDLKEIDPTSNENYPKSAMNRVLVTHALSSLGLTEDDEVCIASGLPYKGFYLGRKINKKLIEAKQQNLMKNDVELVVLDRENPYTSRKKIPRIVSHHVTTEGVSAWVDYVIERDPDTGTLSFNDELCAEPIAIVDIGGRTTDIVLIENRAIDTDRSTTVEHGMLKIERNVQDLILEEFEQTLNIKQLNEVMKKRTLTLFGKPNDVSSIVEQAIEQEVKSIHAEVSRQLRNGSDVSAVIFVGGTTSAIAHKLDGWFRNQKIAHDPSFANARGMAKYAEILSYE